MHNLLTIYVLQLSNTLGNSNDLQGKKIAPLDPRGANLYSSNNLTLYLFYADTKYVSHSIWLSFTRLFIIRYKIRQKKIFIFVSYLANINKYNKKFNLVLLDYFI